MAAAAGRCFRCVLLEPLEPGGEVEAEAEAEAPAGAFAKFVFGGGAAPVVARGGTVAEGGLRFAALECELAAPAACTEVQCQARSPCCSIARTGADVASLAPHPTPRPRCRHAPLPACAPQGGQPGGAPARLPPFRVDVWEEAGGVWRLLQCQPMPTAEEINNSGRGAVRCFVPYAVPTVAPPPDVVACPALIALVESEGGVAVLKGWPRKQKQQAAATLWLALHLVPGRSYREEEMDWLIGTHFTRAKVPDCPTIRKEFERCGLVERQAGGGGFQVLPEGVRRALDAFGFRA